MRLLTGIKHVVVLVAATLLIGTGADLAAGHVHDGAHVVLGDSIEFGLGADTTAYVPLFRQYLEGNFFNGEADLHNLGTPGATVRDVNHNQLFPAIAAIKSHHPVVVSWGGGGNDLLDFITSPQAATCLRGNVSCVTRLNALLNEMEQTIDLTLGALRSTAGPTTTILVRTQYNPFLQQSCGGPSDPQAQLAQVVLEGGVPFLARGLNDRIRDLATKHGARVADIAPLFVVAALGTETILISSDCIHPNDAGHQVISAAMQAAFVSP